jgi:hypothetical protein
VSAPTQVRYAYAGNPIGNLINVEGLPASPFQTEGPQLIPTGLSPSRASRAAASSGGAAISGPRIRFPGPCDALGRARPVAAALALPADNRL